MRDNMNKVLERDSKIGDLEDKAGYSLWRLSEWEDGLREGANRFEKKAVKLKRTMQWKNLKVAIDQLVYNF